MLNKLKKFKIKPFWILLVFLFLMVVLSGFKIAQAAEIYCNSIADCENKSAIASSGDIIYANNDLILLASEDFNIGGADLASQVPNLTFNCQGYFIRKNGVGDGTTSINLSISEGTKVLNCQFDITNNYGLLFANLNPLGNRPKVELVNDLSFAQSLDLGSAFTNLYFYHVDLDCQNKTISKTEGVVKGRAIYTNGSVSNCRINSDFAQGIKSSPLQPFQRVFWENNNINLGGSSGTIGINSFYGVREVTVQNNTITADYAITNDSSVYEFTGMPGRLYNNNFYGKVTYNPYLENAIWASAGWSYDNLAPFDDYLVTMQGNNFFDAVYFATVNTFTPPSNTRFSMLQAQNNYWNAPTYADCAKDALPYWSTAGGSPEADFACRKPYLPYATFPANGGTYNLSEVTELKFKAGDPDAIEPSFVSNPAMANEQVTYVIQVNGGFTPSITVPGTQIDISFNPSDVGIVGPGTYNWCITAYDDKGNNYMYGNIYDSYSPSYWDWYYKNKGEPEYISGTNPCITFTIAAVADFSLSAAPSAIIVLSTDTNKTSTITVTSLNDFNDTVDLSTFPSNGCIIKALLDDDSIKPPKNGNKSTFLNIDTFNCPVGIHSIIIQGESGGDIRTTTINLTVQVNNYGYAWGENTGWIRFSCKDKSAGGIGGQPQTGDKCAVNGGVDYGVLTTDDALYGYAWGENIGWVSMNCDQTLVGGGNNCGIPYAVSNDIKGNLSDYAWSENIGWISFNDTINPSPLYQVKINETGVFSGYAWSETAGYISFNSAGPPEYYVQTEWLGTNTPPQQPHTPNPTDDQNKVSVYLNQLQWKSGDEDPLDILWFDIYFDTDEDKVDSDPVTEGVILDSVRLFNDFTTGTPTPLDNPFLYTHNLAGWPGLNLEPNTFYYWRVSAFDGKDFVFSPVPVWEFKTVVDEPDIRTSEDADHELNFGAVKIGATKTMYVVVCNFPVKNKKLTTSNISLIGGANGFSLGTDIYYVDKNGNTTTGSILSVNDLAGIDNDGGNDGKCASSVLDKPSYNIMVKFSPGAVVVPDDTLNIESDDPDTPYQITLKGDGEAIASPAPAAPSGGVKIRR